MLALPPERPIRFFHRGEVVALRGQPVTRTVLDWLREDAHCTGTKEGCNEGDCGACTVLVAELPVAGAASGSATAPRPAAARDALVGGLRLRSVNACLLFLPALDGRALLTVEDLAGIAGGAPHPVQRALVDAHASQCGFCTPGFAMSLAACYEQHAEAGTRPTRAALADALSGNLCRCTGYRPILDAGERMFDAPPARLPTAPIVAALERLRQDPPLHCAGPAPAAPGGSALVQRFHAPRDLDALAALRAARPDAVLLAGATDVALWVNKQLRTLPELIHVGAVDALRRIEWLDGEGDGAAPRLRIGAAVALEDAWQALVALAPGLEPLWRRFGSPPVRHAGTMGGNVANGSPIGDSAPALMALGAALWLRRGARRRRVPLDGFYTGYQRNRLEPGEFVEAIELPRPSPDTRLRGYKLSKRHDCDISAVAAGLALTLDAHGTVSDARFAFGGMAATLRRAACAEAAVRGRPWDEATAQGAMDALDGDFEPLDDLRASASYRRRGARALLRRLWLETRLRDPLPQEATSVWPAPTRRAGVDAHGAQDATAGTFAAGGPGRAAS